MTEPNGAAEKFRGSRRGFIGWMGKVGLIAIGGVAGVMATGKAAEADVQPRANWRCCNLYFYPPNCPLDQYGQPICNRGSLKTWSCCSGGRKYACGECTSGSSCQQGTYYCSAGWTLNNSC